MSQTPVDPMAPVEELPCFKLPDWRELMRKVLSWHGSIEGRKRRYGMAAGCGLGSIWLLSLLVLAFWPRQFTSEATLVLPSAGGTSAVSLERIGQASSNSASPFGASGLSPMVNYKEILESRQVATVVAETLGMEKTALAKPRAKVVDQTQLISVQMSGPSAGEAQLRLATVLSVFQDELERLRRDESDQRDFKYRVTIKEFQRNLEQIRARILAHQASSGLVTMDQYSQLIEIIEQLAKQATEAAAMRQQKEGEASQLTSSLGITASGAADALALQSDPVFRGLLGSYAEATQKLSANLTKWGDEHPEVMAARGQRDAAQTDMRKRARQLIGRIDDKLLKYLEADAGRNQADLLQRLVSVGSEATGYGRQAQELESRIAVLRERVVSKSNDAAILEDLMRDLQLAEAVFRTALARIDTGKTDHCMTTENLGLMIVSSGLTEQAGQHGAPLGGWDQGGSQGAGQGLAGTARAPQQRGGVEQGAQHEWQGLARLGRNPKGTPRQAAQVQGFGQGAMAADRLGRGQGGTGDHGFPSGLHGREVAVQAAGTGAVKHQYPVDA
ncbi:hypothetical protein MCP1_70049 [Candidatus Terasakiella magnetica]|nr:hypothetical protein MCP1_70049 [Candidatus Terasakiella magnetica]